jgi:hypothetical protein
MAKKEAGAGRGFVNPQRTDESNTDYITPAQRAEMEQQVQAAKDQSASERAYNASVKGMKKGGTASARADGIAARGKTRGKIC